MSEYIKTIEDLFKVQKRVLDRFLDTTRKKSKKELLYEEANKYAIANECEWWEKYENSYIISNLTVIPAKRGKSAEYVLNAEVAEILKTKLKHWKINQTINTNVKNGFDFGLNNIASETKYALETPTDLWKKVNGVYKKVHSRFGRFTFDQVRPFSEKYEYLMFLFARPKESDCLYYSVKRSILEDSINEANGDTKKHIIPLSRQHSSSNASWICKVGSQKSLNKFKQFGDGTLEYAIKKIVEKR